ncbi:hypothetical protein Ctob_007387, partial [Chrysochromulina tobinii]
MVRKREEGEKIKAAKKAEADAARKAKAAEMAAQKKAEAEAERARAVAEETLSAELGMGTYEMKGDRGYMEDRLNVRRLPTGDLFAGVYDGHCGEKCAEWANTKLHLTLMETPEFVAGDIGEGLRQSFHITNDEYMATGGEDGTTACALVIRGNTLHVANAGDSRAVVCNTAGQAVWATVDHKPDGPEKKRIEALGGVVDYGGIVSPDGQNFLKCARSLGDAKYKVGPRSQHLICAEPDVFRRELTDEDDIIVMGSDGVWDVLSDQKACEIALKALKENPGKPHLAAKAVALGAYQAESEDNICAAVLLLKRRPGLSGGTAAAQADASGKSEDAAKAVDKEAAAARKREEGEKIKAAKKAEADAARKAKAAEMA